MWIFSTIGFFSATQVSDKPEVLQIRARVRTDLDNLRAKYLPLLSETVHDLSDTVEIKGRDYPYRAYTDRASFAAVIGQMILDVDYSNFKSEVIRTQGLAREQLYADVWSVMNNAERKIKDKETRNSKRYVSPYPSSHGSYADIDNDLFWSRFDSRSAAAKESTNLTGQLDGETVEINVTATEADNATAANEFLRNESRKAKTKVVVRKPEKSLGKGRKGRDGSTRR